MVVNHHGRHVGGNASASLPAGWKKRHFYCEKRRPRRRPARLRRKGFEK
jgi:uncharacterized protein YbdZ (MbtH family)